MRKYGQHFLVNKGIIDKITDAVIDNMEGALVEIGPGKGAITTALLERGVNNFTLIEIDPEMADYLKNNLPKYAEVEIKNNDFLKEDLSFLPEGPVTFVSNLPYIDAAEILLKVLSAPGLHAAVFMFQREQAQRLTAKPESKHYGPLSVLFQASASARSICRVSPGSFNPPPKVDSEVLLIMPKGQIEFKSAKHKKDFTELVKSVFAYRRKTVLNALCEVFKKDKDLLGAALQKAGVKISARAEELSPRKYADLALALDGIIF